MKLTNLSLAILVALGVAACGGSDNDNQTVDHNNGNNNGGNSGSTGTTTNKPTIPPVLDPTRAAPTMSVYPSLEGMVKEQKNVALLPNSTNAILGYDSAGNIYDPDLGTNPKNIKYTSTYNFKKSGDIVHSKEEAVNLSFSTAKPEDAIGAIYIGDQPKNTQYSAYALGSDGTYYRVKSNADAANYTNATKFTASSAGGTVKFSGGNDKSNIPQSAIVFIANADLTKDVKLGDASDFDSSLKQVRLGNISVFGQEVSSVTGGDIHLGSVPVKKDKIQESEITGKYVVENDKEGSKYAMSYTYSPIKLGSMKLYNLPYSAAMVTANLDNNQPKNIFSENYVVMGLKTDSIPKKGRATYTGKYFDADSSGNISLLADFSSGHAGIQGSITDRKATDGRVLPKLGLERVQISGHTSSTAAAANAVVPGKGKVSGDITYADQWDGYFYGPNSEEVAGHLYQNNDAVGVYSSQRGILSDNSLK